VPHFSLVLDRTHRRAIRRVFPPRFLGKVYGPRPGALCLRTLIRTLLPGPDISRRAGEVMPRSARQALKSACTAMTHRLQDFVTHRDARWTEQQIAAPRALRAGVWRTAAGARAAGWQMNEAAFVFEERGPEVTARIPRGLPVSPQVAGRGHCPQWPTTLPTLDELIASTGVTGPECRSGTARAAPLNYGMACFHATRGSLRVCGCLPVFERLLTAGARRVMKSFSMATQRAR